jgi:cobalamin-dependent methionine synthase I
LIVIGERLNSTRKAVAEAVEKGDSEYVRGAAEAQVRAGADFLDVNAGTFFDSEPEKLAWMVETVQGAVDVTLSIDSVNAEAVERALEVHRGRALLNSVSGEKGRIEHLAPIIRKHRPRIIALCMDEDGLPDTVERTVLSATRVVDLLAGLGVGQEDIFLDPLIRPIGTDPSFGKLGIDSTAELKKRFPAVKTICGLSNVSFGLPKRRLLNQSYLPMLIAAGLDAVIADTLDRGLMATLRASLALSGSDAYCSSYIKAYRQGLLP